MLQVVRSPVFLGLTRPSMVLGVSSDYFGCGFILWLSGFVLTENPWVLIGWLPYHLLGWTVCQVEPNFFRLLYKSWQCGRMPNRSLWGCRVYEPF